MIKVSGSTFLHQFKWHRWDANSQDYAGSFHFRSFWDIGKSFGENAKLVNAHWSDKVKGAESFKRHTKLFARHGDGIYRNIPSLQK